jgi:hypothetical protein
MQSRAEREEPRRSRNDLGRSRNHGIGTQPRTVFVFVDICMKGRKGRMEPMSGVEPLTY